jgi:hypothetical protein
MSEKIEDRILENAAAPKKADIDGQVVEQHSIDDQIKAAKFYASMKALKSRRAFRVSKLVPGGAE